MISEHVKNYIQSLVSKSSGEFSPSVIEDALAGVRFPTHIINARARIMHYCASFFEKLEAVGYEDYRDENAKQIVHLLLRHVEPTFVQNKMFQFVKFDTSLEKSFPKFIAKLKKEAISCQEYGEQLKSGPQIQLEQGLSPEKRRII